MKLSQSLAGAALILPAFSAASAQEPSRPDPLRERTGPNAAAPVLPAYPRGQDFPAAPAPSAASEALSGTVALASVDVAVTGAGSPLPLPRWTPAADPATGLSLSHRPGEPLDAGWVRRQFEENGLVGRPAPLDRLVSLVQQINLAYLANGYINSGVLIAGGRPTDGGVLQLNLVLGRLAAQGAEQPGLSVAWGANGARGLSERYVTKRMWAANAVPLNAAAVERQFRLLAEDPAIRTINADLRPGNQPGEASLALTVSPADRFDFYLTASNSRSPSIGGERYAVGGSMRNFFGAGDLLTAETGLTSGRSDFLIGYETPLDLATSARIRLGYNEAAVVDRPLRPLDIEAREFNGEAALIRRLVQRPLLPAGEGGRWRAARTISVGMAIAARRTETSLLGSRFSFSPGSVNGVAEYQALRITGDWVERGISQVIAVSLTGTQGIGGTIGDVPGILQPDPNFRSIVAQASFARRLDSRGLELRLRLTGQAADGILYSGERLAAGGEYTVRGYRETLILADTGIIGSAELAKSFSLTRARRRSDSGIDWGAFSASIFTDGAWLHNRAGPQPVPDHLASVGASLAWVPSQALFARVTFGQALKEAPIVGSRDLQDRGFQFRIVLRPLALRWR